MYSFSCCSLSHLARSFFYGQNFFSLCQYNNDKTRLSLLYPLTQNFVVYVAKTIWPFQSINSMEQFFLSLSFSHVCVRAFWLNSIRSIRRLVNCTVCASEKPWNYTHFFGFASNQNNEKWMNGRTIRRCIEFGDCL